MSRLLKHLARPFQPSHRPWLMLIAAAALLCAAVGGEILTEARAQPETTGEQEGQQEREFNVHRTLVAGSEPLLYVVQQDEEQGRFQLRFAKAEALDQLMKGLEAQGEAVGLAAYDETAYIVYNDHSVQSMRWTDPPTPQARPFEIRQLPPLPRNGMLVDLVAVDHGELVAVLAPLEATDADDPPDRPNNLPDPPTRETAGEEAGDDEPATEADGEPAAEPQPEDADDADDATPSITTDTAIGELTLLRHVRNRWERLDWPVDLNRDDFLGLVQAPPDRPELLSRTADGQGIRYHSYRGAETGWRTDRFAIAPAAWTAALHAQHARLLLRADQPQGPIEVYLTRGEGPLHGTLEQVHSPEHPVQRVWTAPTGGVLTLVFVDEAQLPAYWQWDLDEPMPSVDAVTPMELADLPVMTYEPVVWLLVAAMALALLMLLATMGNAEQNTPRLPASLRPAGVPRIWAALIDFVPALLISMMIFSLGDPVEILRNWPGLREWDQTPPAIVVIGIHTLHTLLAELFTGTSVGKKLMGCRVVNLEGGPPHIWQIVGRNLFKILEMAMPLLLLLPVLPSLLPHQQRLGDLVARTLVVTDVPESEQPREEKKDPEADDETAEADESDEQRDEK